MKNCDIFSYLCSKHRLWVDEAVLTSTFNLCFRAKNKKIMYTPVTLNYIKVGCKGVTLHGHAILMEKTSSRPFTKTGYLSNLQMNCLTFS